MSARGKEAPYHALSVADRQAVYDKAVAESRARVDRQVEKDRGEAVARGEISEAAADVERRNQRRHGLG